jgi:hypothetical protein
MPKYMEPTCAGNPWTPFRAAATARDRHQARIAAGATVKTRPSEEPEPDRPTTRLHPPPSAMNQSHLGNEKTMSR